MRPPSVYESRRSASGIVRLVPIAVDTALAVAQALRHRSEIGAQELASVRADRRLREALEEEARFTALQLPQARRQLEIAAKADTVAGRRFDVAKNRYVIGRIDIGALYIAQGEKDAATLAFVQALRGYWLTYYRLRRLTLYDFERGEALRR